MINEDGTGAGWKQKIDERNFAHTFGINESESIDATRNGRAFNINSGLITLTTNSSTRNTLLYFKNDEDDDYVITGTVVGVFDRSASISDDPIIYMVRNPTGGTTITNATAADVAGSNNNFGSNKTLKTTTLMYKGADSDGAMTGGTDHLLALGSDGRTPIVELAIDLPKGSSIGIEIDGNTTGSFQCYAALIGFKRDPKLG